MPPVTRDVTLLELLDATKHYPDEEVFRFFQQSSIAWHGGWADAKDTLRLTFGQLRKDLAELVISQIRDPYLACPCHHTTPCHDSCACLNPTSSSGCRRCCSYGSDEQRRAMAEHLVGQQRYDGDGKGTT